MFSLRPTDDGIAIDIYAVKHPSRKGTAAPPGMMPASLMI